MVLSFALPLETEWTDYYNADDLIGDLERDGTPHAVRMLGSLSGERAAAMGDALAENASLKWVTGT